MDKSDNTRTNGKLTHWLLRIGNGNHFNNSSSKYIWGINSKHSCSKSFINKVKDGDILWFVTGGSGGHLVAMATYKSMNNRIIGPLINHSFTNADLGWTEKEGDWDMEIHYKNLYNISKCSLYSGIKGNVGIRVYNDKCKVNLLHEYINILKYSNITRTM
tara:strand:- start:235 stop:714 length:480 start_codon:yes stop_codon:yes gene_type:complete